MDNPIMEPSHYGWREFITRLASAEGCNVREELGGTKIDCAHDFSRTKKILGTMEGIDIDSSLEQLSQYGDCDCTLIVAWG